jgi:hypothetical protein
VEVEAVIQRVEEDLAVAEAAYRAAEGRVRELRAVRDGLMIALERYSDKPSTSVVSVDTDATVVAIADSRQPAPVSVFNGDGDNDSDDGIRSMRLKDATIRVLKRTHRPVTTREVYDRMHQAGRPENHEQVRSSLNYLKRVDRVKRTGQHWELNESPSDESEGDQPEDLVRALVTPSQEAVLHSQ